MANIQNLQFTRVLGIAELLNSLLCSSFKTDLLRPRFESLTVPYAGDAKCFRFYSFTRYVNVLHC